MQRSEAAASERTADSHRSARYQPAALSCGVPPCSNKLHVAQAWRGIALCGVASYCMAQSATHMHGVPTFSNAWPVHACVPPPPTLSPTHTTAASSGNVARAWAHIAHTHAGGRAQPASSRPAPLTVTEGTKWLLACSITFHFMQLAHCIKSHACHSGPHTAPPTAPTGRPALLRRAHLPVKPPRRHFTLTAMRPPSLCPQGLPLMRARRPPACAP